jgi:hypothetical protein
MSVFNQPMSQFEVIDGYLVVVDTSRYNFSFGFSRIVRDLKPESHVVTPERWP